MSDYKIVQNGNRLRVIPSQAMIVLETALPVAYQVVYNPRAGFELEMTQQQHDPPGKVYGDLQQNAERIITSFTARGRSTGVLLSGIKGTGKSMMARMLASMGRDRGWPTLIISESFHGTEFNQFMASLHQPCVVLLDEYEKVYKDDDAKNGLLSMLDGTLSSNKLFVFTVNNVWNVSNFMLNRPGRVYYSLRFDKIDPQVVQQYLDDMLVNKQHAKALLQICDMFTGMSFDMLAALVEEMNRFDISPLEAMNFLNVKSDYLTDTEQYTSRMICEHDGYTYSGNTQTVSFNPWSPKTINLYGSLKCETETAEIDSEDFDEYFNPENITAITKNEVVFVRGSNKAILTRVANNRPDVGYLATALR